MAADVTFQLDPDAASTILTDMVAPLIEQSGLAIGARAQAMANSMSKDPPTVTVNTKVGVNPGGKGQRAIAYITATGHDAHSNYIGHQALAKAKDAGRV